MLQTTEKRGIKMTLFHTLVVRFSICTALLGVRFLDRLLPTPAFTGTYGNWMTTNANRWKVEPADCITANCTAIFDIVHTSFPRLLKRSTLMGLEGSAACHFLLSSRSGALVQDVSIRSTITQLLSFIS